MSGSESGGGRFADPGSVVLDVTGLACPLPVLRLGKALRSAAPGTLILVRASDPMARVDIPHLCQTTGDLVEEITDEPDGFVIRVRKAGPGDHGASGP